MHTDTPTKIGAVASPSYEDLLSHAEKTTRDVLKRAVTVIDAEFKTDYALRNPEFTKHIARILFDEFCVTRAHAGAKRR